MINYDLLERIEMLNGNPQFVITKFFVYRGFQKSRSAQGGDSILDPPPPFSMYPKRGIQFWMPSFESVPECGEF